MGSETAMLYWAMAASTAVSVQQGEQNRKQANRAADAARADADQTFNRANQKKPNPTDLASDNMMSQAGGAGSTMLTGPGGVDPSKVPLSRGTLLGRGGPLGPG